MTQGGGQGQWCRKRKAALGYLTTLLSLEPGKGEDSQLCFSVGSRGGGVGGSTTNSQASSDEAMLCAEEELTGMCAKRGHVLAQATF